MKKNIITLVLVCMALIHSVKAQQTEDLALQGSKGKLAATLQTPKIENGKKVRMVIICHGFGANKDRPLLRAIANHLQEAGIASIRFDFNGCGKSEGRFEDMTVLNEIEDAKKVIDYAQKLPWVSGISIVGHSQGGVVASMVAGQLKHQEYCSLCPCRSIARRCTTWHYTRRYLRPSSYPRICRSPPRIAYGTRLYCNSSNASYLRNCQRVQRTCPCYSWHLGCGSPLYLWRTLPPRV